MEPKAHVIYPAYINKNRTIADGRRISQSIAVPDPKHTEIVDALYAIKGFANVQPEPKPYPREPNKEFMPWRIRYAQTNTDQRNKRQILHAVAKKINEIREKSKSSNPSTTEGSKKKKK